MTKFLSPLVVQVPSGFMQAALRKRKALHFPRVFALRANFFFWTLPDVRRADGALGVS